MSSRLLSFVVWALVAASAVFWALRLSTVGGRTPAHASVAGLDTQISGGGDLSRLFGVAAPTVAATTAAAAPAPADSRFKLLGVVAVRATSPTEGLALISVDGKPARAVGLGGTVDDMVVLLSVGHRRAELGPRGGPAQMTLELPGLAEAARTSLRPAGGADTHATPAARPIAVAPPPPPPPVMAPDDGPGGLRPVEPQGVEVTR